MKVKEILRRKGNQIISVSPNATVLDALRLMAEKNLSGVMVMEGEDVKGIFTERDYARKIVLRGRTSADSQISEVMVTNLVTITPEASVNDCMQLMTGKLIRHLPVLEGEKIVGIISIGDVVKSMIEEQQDVIQHLEQYIAGQ